MTAAAAPETFTPGQRAFLTNARQIAPVALDRTEPLFRFLRYASPPEQQSVQDALVHRRFRFGRPRDFNDPFDCRPHLYVPGLFPACRRHWFERETMKMVLRKHPNNPAAEQSARAQLAGRSTEWQVEQAELNVRNALLDTQRMLCLCGDNEHVLMWAYYADRHRGVAIHVRPDVWPVAVGLKVAYTNRYPALPLSDLNDKRKITRAFVLTKATAWRHEHEYRVLVQDEDAQRFAVEWTSADTAVFPPGAVAGVTVGCLMDDRSVQQVIASAGAASPAVPVYRAKAQRKRFKLDFERVA